MSFTQNSNLGGEKKQGRILGSVFSWAFGPLCCFGLSFVCLVSGFMLFSSVVGIGAFAHVCTVGYVVLV